MFPNLFNVPQRMAHPVYWHLCVVKRNYSYANTTVLISYSSVVVVDDDNGCSLDLSHFVDADIAARACRCGCC